MRGEVRTSGDGEAAQLRTGAEAKQHVGQNKGALRCDTSGLMRRLIDPVRV